MIPPKDSPLWRRLVERPEVPFKNLATRMMFKRCQMLIKLNPGSNEKVDEAAQIAHGFFEANREIVGIDLDIVVRDL